MVTGLGVGRDTLHAAVLGDRHVHEQVQRRWRVGALNTVLGQRFMEIVGAIAVVFGAAQFLVDGRIAGAEQGVVAAWGSVFDHGQHGAAQIADQGHAGVEENLAVDRAGMFQRDALARVGEVDRPGVDYLVAVQVDDADGLTLAELYGGTPGSFQDVLVFNAGLGSVHVVSPVGTDREGRSVLVDFGYTTGMQCKCQCEILYRNCERTMNQCLMPQPIHPTGITHLQAAGLEPVIGEQAFAVADPDRVVAGIFRSTPFGRTEMERFKNLRVIGVHGAGFDNIDLNAARELGVTVFNIPGRNARSVAEHVLGLIFALSKQLLASDRAARAGNMAFRFDARLHELHGRTLGLVGFGAIGRATGVLAVALGMRVQVFARSADAGQLAALGMQRADSLKALLSGSDIVSLHLPAVPQTYQMISHEQLGWMKPGALLINTGRAPLIDEPALIEALQAGVIAGAGLDVYAFDQMPADYPLLHLPNVVLTPHTGGSTQESLIRMAADVTQGVLDVLAGHEPQDRLA